MPTQSGTQPVSPMSLDGREGADDDACRGLLLVSCYPTSMLAWEALWRLEADMSLQTIVVPTHCWERVATGLSSPQAVRCIANFNKCCKKFSIGPKDVTKYSYPFREEVLPKTKVINKIAKKPTPKVTNNKHMAKVIKKPKTNTAKGHSEDWWKRDLPDWVFEEAMATAEKNNQEEEIVQPIAD